MLSASYPPLMDPVMDTASEGFKEGRAAHLFKIELACQPVLVASTSICGVVVVVVYYMVRVCVCVCGCTIITQKKSN